MTPTWEVSRVGLAAYCRRLGIYWPVEVRRTHSKTSRGAYGLSRHRRVHQITADRAAPYAAEATLRHELQHAKQAERAGSLKAWEALHAEQMRYPYAKRPIELEAMAAEQRNLDIDLTRRLKRCKMRA